MDISLNPSDLAAMDRLYRTALVQSVSGFKSLNLLGTADPEGRSNLAVISSVIHIGSQPALLGWISRPDSVERHSLSNIMASGVFTLNHVHQDIFRKAHQTSARYPKEVSEFAACGLSEQYVEGFHAPFVAESRIKLGLRLEQRMEIPLNGTILLIGSIQHLIVPEACLGPDGFVDLEQAGTLTSSGLDSYHDTRRLDRLAYAKPFQVPDSLPGSWETRQ